MYADVVGEPALSNWDDSPTDNCSDQQTGTVSRERPELSETKRKYGRKHDWIEEGDKDDAPHGNVPSGKHRNDYEHHRTHRKDSEQRTRLHFLQNGGADKTADHSTTPIKRDVPGRSLLGEVADGGLRKIVNQKAADRNFRANINENSYGAKNQ